MDDFIILSEDPEELREILKKVEIFLRDRLHLRLNPKTTMIAAKNGVDFVGYRHFPSFKIIRKSATRRLKKLIHAFKTGEVDEELFDNSIKSRLGYMKHADTYNLVISINKEVEAVKARTKTLGF